MGEWDDFADKARDEQRPPGITCGIARMLNQQIPEDARTTVAAALDNPGITTSALHRELTKRVTADCPSRFTVGRHRRRECGCPPAGDHR